MDNDTSEAETDGKAQWQKTGGFAADTERVTIAVKEQKVSEWEAEAYEAGFSNRSDYLRTLIAEARAYRSNDVRTLGAVQRRVQELQSEVERLEDELERGRRSRAGQVSFDDPRFIERFLTENYQPLSEILQGVVESGALNDLVRKPVENQLYQMAADDRVEFERGWGWKLTNGGEIVVSKKWEAEKGIDQYPKSGAGYRRFALRPATVAILDEYTDNGYGGGQSLFGAYSTVYTWFKDGFTEADVRVKNGTVAVRPHWTRHTTLTYLLNARERIEGYYNWSKEDLQAYAGHKSMSMTEKYATFVDREFFDGLADAFGWDT